MPAVDLPAADGRLERVRLTGTPVEPPRAPRRFSRIAIAAVHVVADPLADCEPADGAAIDWEATLAYRRHLLDLGFGVAEAMDTAQRGMGLGWPDAARLIEASLAAADPGERGRIVCGVGTDQLDAGAARSTDDIVRAYLEQLSFVEERGGRVVLMASRELARIARRPEEYADVLGRVLAQCSRPAILHWLGEMFDPALRGYWGSADFPDQAQAVLRIVADNRAKVDGIKLSLLDAGHEIALRRRLPEGIVMYTGDDFNFPDLILGDGEGHSDALLGIFDPVAVPAAAALAALAGGDRDGYRRLLDPTVPLSRHIFRAPTRHYKTGVVFLAWLNGFQDHFTMLAGAQSMRPLPYFADLLRLADRAGALADPELAAARMKRFLALYGIGR